MSVDLDHTSSRETEPALRAVLALLVADRHEREAESILARAGLDEDQIASILENGSGGRPQSVIDRAREALTRAA